MSFEGGVMAFAERFLSDRTFQLIVAPALADLHYAGGASRIGRVAHRVAVIRALAGGFADDIVDASGQFFLLSLLPTGYFLTMLCLCADFFPTSTSLAKVAALVLVLSLGPVMMCFWPERRSLPRAD